MPLLIRRCEQHYGVALRQGLGLQTLTFAATAWIAAQPFAAVALSDGFGGSGGCTVGG